MADNFGKIKKYLQRLRNAKSEILMDEDNLLQFEIKNAHFCKLFTVHYRNSDSPQDSLTLQRPMYHHYYLQFEQDLVPCRRGFLTTVTEWRWFTDEDDVLDRIRNLRQRFT